MTNYCCLICGNKRELSFTETVLKKYKVNYFYCAKCGLLQTEQPYWLEDAYNTAISNTDTGLVQRNLYNSQVLSCLLYFLIGKNGKYCDVAGGYGMLTRLMRDVGFDFYWTDKYCKNLLSSGFEADKTEPPFNAITAFEVLEHIYDPIAFLKESLSLFKTGTIIFSTQLFKIAPPRTDEWWYYSFESGQHISFYQERTLKFISYSLGTNFYTSNNFHMMSNRHIGRCAFRLLTANLVTSCLSKYINKKMKSKTMSDHKKLSNYHLIS
jgi:hypothetical protein